MHIKILIFNLYICVFSYSFAIKLAVLNGSLTQDFQLVVFFHESPWTPEYPFRTISNFFRKFAEIFANELTTPGITKNSCQGLITGVNDTGDKFIAEQLIASVVDTGKKHSFAREFSKKNSKRPRWNTWGHGGHLFMKKTRNRKSSVRLPLKFNLCSRDNW